MNNASERIEIINSYIPLFGTKNKSTKYRIVFNTIITLLLIIIFGIAIIIVFGSIFAEISGIESKFSYNKASQMVNMSIGSMFFLESLIYRNPLLKHLKKITNNPLYKNDDELNLELSAIIERLNKPKKDYFMAVILVILLLSVTANYLMDGGLPHYNLLIVPTLLLYFFTVYNVTKTYQQIKLNINKAEAKL